MTVESKEEQKVSPENQMKKKIVINTTINTTKEVGQKSSSTRSHQKAVLIKQVPKCLHGPKHFIFSEALFNVGSPTSINRVFLVSQFLIQKIGQLKFDQVNVLLSSSADPLKMLVNEKDKIMSILGQENEELLSVLKFLITSNNPSTNHSRTKSILTPTAVPHYLSPQNSATNPVHPVISPVTSSSSISPLSIDTKSKP